ncbi:antirestriction protein [Aeromonas caviae]|uniref:antirestriction protein n=1 Tax=Aeromonas caviae TaxID=648 RepID=UPI0029D83140|nr:antirestriction protein [Aeromonas caviae]MDX7789003.1 antirestriction protein [Aeromonas caviae]MDX7800714.1 antirestriction protein [Aeromonas caviae]
MQTAVVERQSLKVHTVSAQHIRLLNTLGKGAIFMENLVFSFMDQLCAEYQGGSWEYCEDSLTGTWYMRPVDTSQSIHIAVFGNFFDEKVSPDAAGVIVTLFALNTLCYRFQNEPKVFEAFERLKEFAAKHQEGGAIYRAID